jgi:hypothetical protein
MALAHTNRQLDGETIPLFEKANRRLQLRRRNVKYLKEWEARQTEHLENYGIGNMRGGWEELFARLEEDAERFRKIEAEMKSMEEME